MLDERMGRNRLQDLKDDPGTGGAAPPGVDVTATEPSATVHVQEFGFLRSRVRALSEDVGDSHRNAWMPEWERQIAVRSKASPQEMLGELADYGFAWRDIARLVQVSVPAVQKWRRGEGCSGPSRKNIAALLAMCDLITQHFQVQEVASWFEMPVMLGIPVTPMDLYAKNQHRLVFEYASEHVDPEQILTLFDENWRERYRTDHEVFVANDGELSIRSRVK